MAVETVRYIYEADTNKFVREVNKAKDATSGFQSVMGKTGGAIQGLAKETRAFSAAATLVGGVAAKTAIDFTKLYESTMVVFDQMLGGPKAATALYDTLLDIAKASTYSQEAFLVMGKSLVSTGLDSKRTAHYIDGIVNSVAAYGGATEDLHGLSTAYSKALTQQTLDMQLVNSLAANGVNALKILGNSYGLTTMEMKKMISTGTVPSKEALDLLTDGILKGTDGVNGYTHAMEGMALQLKGGTLTGAIDSLNTGVRSFSLNLLRINPTLKETDEHFDDSQQRIKQLTAVFASLSDILPKLANLFSGFTDSFGRFLDKLVGKNADLDTTTTLMGRFSNYLDTADPKKLESIGNAILAIAAFAPTVAIITKLTNVTKLAAGPFVELGKALVTSGGSLKELMPVLSPLTIKLAAIAAAVAAVVAVLVIMYNKSEAFRETVDALVKTGLDLLRDAFERLQPLIEKLSEVLGHLMDVALSALHDIFENAIVPIMEQVIELWEAIGPPILDLVEVLVSILMPALDILIIWWEILINVLSFVIQVFMKVISWINQILQPGEKMAAILNILVAVGRIVSAVFTVVSNAIVKLYGKMKDSAPIRFMSSALSGLANGVQWVIDKISTLIGWFTNLQNKASAVTSSIGGFISKINPFKSAAEFGIFGPDPFAMAGNLNLATAGAGGAQTINNYTFNVTQTGQLDKSSIRLLKGRANNL